VSAGAPIFNDNLLMKDQEEEEIPIRVTPIVSGVPQESLPTRVTAPSMVILEKIKKEAKLWVAAGAKNLSTQLPESNPLM
jgi:hypothetical protein